MRGGKKTVTVTDVVLFVMIILIATGISLVRWRSYNRVTGSQMSYWDWMWTTPQVRDVPVSK